MLDTCPLSIHAWYDDNIGIIEDLHECFLLKELGKSDKVRGLPSILLLFRGKLNKFNNTGARM